MSAYDMRTKNVTFVSVGLTQSAIGIFYGVLIIATIGVVVIAPLLGTFLMDTTGSFLLALLVSLFVIGGFIAFAGGTFDSLIKRALEVRLERIYPGFAWVEGTQHTRFVADDQVTRIVLYDGRSSLGKAHYVVVVQ